MDETKFESIKSLMDLISDLKIMKSNISVHENYMKIINQSITAHEERLKELMKSVANEHP